MKLRTIKVEDADWDSWKGMAREAGVSLSAWIRSRCNGPDMMGISEAIVSKPSVAKVVREVEQIVKGPQCEHGVPKGYHCWKCGGLAVIK